MPYGKTRNPAMDMIRCNGELSLNICSVGLDARIARDVASCGCPCSMASGLTCSAWR